MAVYLHDSTRTDSIEVASFQKALKAAVGALRPRRHPDHPVAPTQRGFVRTAPAHASGGSGGVVRIKSKRGVLLAVCTVGAKQRRGTHRSYVNCKVMPKGAVILKRERAVRRAR